MSRLGKLEALDGQAAGGGGKRREEHGHVRCHRYFNEKVGGRAREEVGSPKSEVDVTMSFVVVSLRKVERGRGKKRVTEEINFGGRGPI